MGARAKGSLDAPSPTEVDLLQEKATALARATGRLEEALAELDAFHGEAERARMDLVRRAAERLWYVMVQREALGLRNHEVLFSLYRVPPEVRLRAGPAPRPAAGAR